MRALTPRASLAAAAASALAWGSWAALGQVAKVFRRHYINHAFAWTSRDVFWMSPLSNVIYFTAVALLLWLFTRGWRGISSGGLTDGVLAGLALFSVLLPFGGLHLAAVIALAAGVGLQYGRMVVRGSKRLRRAVNASGWAVGGLLVAGGLIERATREGRYAPPAIATPAAGAPNVLVIIWDTVRAASVSLYGYPRPTTPNLAKLAESSVTYEWAMAPSPWTLPSHCSMFTGLQPGEHSCRWDDPLRGPQKTLAEVFAGRGYRTGAFLANHFYTTHETGLERGFARFEDFQTTFRQLLLTSSLGQTAIARDLFTGTTWNARTGALRRLALRGDAKPLTDRKLAVSVTDAFLSWERDQTAPFFAFLNYFDAHDPYEPPPPWDRRFGATPDRQALYDGGIAYMDDELGRLTTELAQRGILDRTIVVVTSDHGELFGEHGLTNHGHALYLPLVHVPLVVRFPERLEPGLRVARTVPLRDLARSLLELAGLPDTMPGRSFLSASWSSAPSQNVNLPSLERVALVETEQSRIFWTKGPAREGAMHGLVDDAYHYIRNAGGREELFAYRSDPAEDTNLAATPAGLALAAQYRALLPLVTRRLVR